MRFPARLACLCVVVAASSCGAGPWRQYEYEEEIFLDLDGSATVIVNSSIPALVALRGLDLDPQPRSRLDRQRLAGAYSSPATRVLRVSRPWRRSGRRFVQVRLDVPDVRRLTAAAPFAWATYRLERTGGDLVYRQRLGAAARVTLEGTGWTGAELVAVRVHFPSRILYHNARQLEDGAPGQVGRGNILTWPQRLSDRLAGVPLEVEARMEPTSVLAATLWVFAIAVSAALVVLVALIWWARRRAPTVHG